ncbi:MAG: GtrA family protein, partial [Gammaproteobacteria bacterium]|nr:GtrA family protein [Gammaproteobacteria bacterium]
YALVGGSVAAADVVFFYIFAKLLSFNYLWVNAIGFMLGTLANYLLSIRLVFKSGARFKMSDEIMLVFFIATTSLLLNQVIIFVLIDKMDMNLMISKLLTVASVFSWNYFSRKHFVFSRRELSRES